MPDPARRLPARHVAILALALALASVPAGCTPGTPGGGDTASLAAFDGVRFVLEVVPGDRPVYIQQTTESRPVGWIRVLDGGRTVALEERCEIPDCGADPVVCGAAIPTVRRLAGAGEAGRVEYVWDGTMSEIDDDVGCELRVPAPSAEYAARFCYGHAADTGGDPNVEAGAAGTVVDPTCVDRAFRLGEDAEVVVRVR